MKIITFTWNLKNYTSQDRLVVLARKGEIKLTSTPRFVDGVNYGSDYLAETLSGEKIASFYKDNGFGFCTQACGIELSNQIKYETKTF